MKTKRHQLIIITLVATVAPFGETPIVGLAPVVGNAIFKATGVRLRSLPLAPKSQAQPTQKAAKPTTKCRGLCCFSA